VVQLGKEAVQSLFWTFSSGRRMWNGEKGNLQDVGPTANYFSG